MKFGTKEVLIKEWNEEINMLSDEKIESHKKVLNLMKKEFESIIN